jgi:uncharacterized membrane protein YhaH (DUF805 family)
VIAQRRGLARPWIAFVPLFGFWIVLCHATDRSGWFALLLLIPTIGGLVLTVMMAFDVPDHHGRSKWWIPALIVPVLNLVGYWGYAFTLTTQPFVQDDTAGASGA